MSTNTPFTIIRDYIAPQSSTPATDDTDVLMRLWYGPRPVQSGAATYDINTANADELTLVDPVNGTSRFAFSTYTTCGLLKAGILTKPGWNAQLVGARYNHPTITGSTSLLLAQAAATAKTSAGVPVYGDTSAMTNVANAFNRSFCFGWEDIVKAVGGRAAHFHERTSKVTIPTYDRDPLLSGGLTSGASQPLGNANRGCARIKSITATVTFGSGTLEMHLAKCTQEQDGESMIVKGFTTATEKIIGSSQLGELGHWSGPEERWVIGLRNTSTALSAISLVIVGELGSYV